MEQVARVNVSALPGCEHTGAALHEPARAEGRALGPCQQRPDRRAARASALQVLRVPVDAPMTVRLDCNHTQRQVKLHLIKSHSLLVSRKAGVRAPLGAGAPNPAARQQPAACVPAPGAVASLHPSPAAPNSQVRKYEGTYTILPWSQGRHPPALPEGLADTLGPDVWRQLHAKLAAASSDAASSSAGQLDAQHKGGGLAVQPRHQGQPAGKRAGRRQRQSLVILHQRLQPGVRPPPGLGGYVRGEAAAGLAGCTLCCADAPGPLCLALRAVCTAAAAACDVPFLLPWKLRCHALTPGLQARCGGSLSACLATCTAPAPPSRRPGPPCRVSPG